MNQNKPLVSIILPVFKSEEFLESCLQSLSNQSYKNIEIVAVVDYLGDNSLRILRKYKKIEPRLRVYKNLQRYGLASTLNRCIKLTRGRFVAFMDPNGVADKSRVNKQVKFLLKNTQVGVVGTQTLSINKKGKTLSNSSFPLLHEDIYRQLIGSASMKFETVMADKTRLPKDIFNFKRGTHYPLVYLDVFMRIGQYKELANLDQLLVKTREIGRGEKPLLNIKKGFSLIKILFNSTANYEYKPSVKSLLFPILRQG